jgi:hypothetical protein
MKHHHDPSNEPTAYDLALQELRDNVAYLREQLVEAVEIVTQLRNKLKEYASEDECASCQGGGVYGKHASEEVKTEIDEADAFLSQNSDLAQK